MIRFRDLAEWADRAMASPWFFVAFNVAIVVIGLASMNASNLFISVVTADAVLLGAGQLRRGWCAVHAKLDEILRALPEANDALRRVEERDEGEIGALRG